MERLREQREEVALFEKVENALTLLSSLAVKPDLWKAQNAYFAITNKLHSLIPIPPE